MLFTLGVSSMNCCPPLLELLAVVAGIFLLHSSSSLQDSFSKLLALSAATDGSADGVLPW